MPDQKLPFRPSRRNRRILLALLSGAGNLSGYPISRAAQAGSGAVYLLLAKLERAGWVASEWGPVFNDEGMRRRFYRLTPYGRVQAFRLLGLEGPFDR